MNQHPTSQIVYHSLARRYARLIVFLTLVVTMGATCPMSLRVVPVQRPEAKQTQTSPHISVRLPTNGIARIDRLVD